MTVEKIDQIREKIIIPASQAADDDWERIGQEIDSLQQLPDHNSIATELLKYINHDDSRVRDAVATSFEVLNINDLVIFEEVAAKMIHQATNEDEDIFAAGRAATFLIKHQDKSDKISQAVISFKTMSSRKRWQSELIENIPTLQILFNN